MKEKILKARDVEIALARHADKADALFLQRFFKTGEGQYGAGDIFIGVRVPMTRAVCKQFKHLPLPEVQKLLLSDIHEHRLAAVILLADQYDTADEAGKQAIFDLYLKNVYDGRINNWDIVDSSAEFIVGKHLARRSRKVLLALAKSENVWQRRVAVLSTFGFIKIGDPSMTIKIAEVLLNDPHDLIQKAVGWMLREMGKRIDEALLIAFLNKHYGAMPRTMLRYAIERLSPELKRHYMKK